MNHNKLKHNFANHNFHNVIELFNLIEHSVCVILNCPDRQFPNSGYRQIASADNVRQTNGANIIIITANYLSEII